MASFDPNSISTKDLHQYLLAIVSPRPIAFVSTLDGSNQPNLAPYSFFNCFSSNPPIVIFSSNRRVIDNTTKDTLLNLERSGECVINTISYHMVRQAALCSVDYPLDVNEFEKSGLTPIPSDLVKPFRVKESLASLECRAVEIKPLGKNGGAGNLIICEVVKIHIQDHAIEGEGKINPDVMDLVGRMGRAFYNRASGMSIFKVVQEVNPIPIGYDGLPEFIKKSNILTANDLGSLSGSFSIPSDDEIQNFSTKEEIQLILKQNNAYIELYQMAKIALHQNDRFTGFCAILLAEKIKK